MTILVVAALLFAGTAWGDTIRLKRRVVLTPHATTTTTAQAVTLADVADLDGPAAQALGDTELDRITATDDRIEVERDAVRNTLIALRANLALIDLSGPARCIVERRQPDASTDPVVPEINTDNVPTHPETDNAGFDIHQDNHPPAAANPGIRHTIEPAAPTPTSSPIAGTQTTIPTDGPNAEASTTTDADTDAGPDADTNTHTSTESRSAIGIADRLTRWIEDRLPYPAHSLRIEYRDHDRALLDRLPARARYGFESLSENTLGRLPIRVQVYRDRELIDSHTVHARVARHAEVAVVTQTINHDQAIDTANVALQSLWLTESRADEPVSDLDAIVGHVANRTLRPGDIVYSDYAQAPRLVRRGGDITVRCFVGPTLITTQATAMEDGQLHQRIRVRNPDNRETYAVTITGPGQARMDLAE